MADSIDSVNLRTMSRASVIAQHARPCALGRAEQASLDRVSEEARGRRILDIGVGGGRTVPTLRAISHDYLGIDCSPGMVAACRQRYADVRFEHADPRAMPQFADGSVFLAVSSSSGIGLVSHEDRLRILRSVHRVLQPGGLFVFSMHNRDSPRYRRGFRLPALEWSGNPLRMLVRTACFGRDTLRRLRNRRRLLPLEVHAEDYAVVNDSDHDYGTVRYCITLAQQRRQLVDTGFAHGAEAYDPDGRAVHDGTAHDAIALIARKPPAAGQHGG